MVLNAQMGKAGPPMGGKDLHVGDFSRGILPAAAPLAISSLTVAGMAMAFARDGSRTRGGLLHRRGRDLARRVARGDQPLRRAAAAGGLLRAEQPDGALDAGRRPVGRARLRGEGGRATASPASRSTEPIPRRSRRRSRGRPERARAGKGPALIELVCMRMCGHAHHDDMLYLGKEPPVSWDYPPLAEAGYADRELYEFWSTRDPIATYAARLEAEGVIAAGRPRRLQEEAEALVEDGGARRSSRRRGRSRRRAGEGVLAGEPPRGARSSRSIPSVARAASRRGRVPAVETGPPFDPKGQTFLEAVDARRRRRAARRPARLRLRRGRRRQVRQRVPAAAAAARGIRRPHPELAARRGRRPRRLRRRGARGRSGRSARCSSTTSSRPASTSSSTTPRRSATAGAARSRWSCGCRGAACGTPGRTTARTPRRGSTGRPA